MSVNYSVLQDYEGGKIVRTAGGRLKFMDKDNNLSEPFNSMAELTYAVKGEKTPRPAGKQSKKNDGKKSNDGLSERATESGNGSAKVSGGNEKRQDVAGKATKKSTKRSTKKQ